MTEPDEPRSEPTPASDEGPAEPRVPEPAREDATCFRHEDRPAFVVCPTCGEDVCLSCFFPEHMRCQRCIEDAPEDVAPPIAFEARPGFAGFVASLLEPFSPRVTAPSVAVPTLRDRAVPFFVATFVPVALLRGVVPYTAHLHFGCQLHVRVDPVSSRALALDVGRAALLSLGESVALFAAFALCYRSLVASFGRAEAGSLASRALFYRGFLFPLGGALGLLGSLVQFAMPIVPAHPLFGPVVDLASVLPIALLAIALHRTARTVARVDMLPGIATILVPFVLLTALSNYTSNAVVRLLPRSLVEPPPDAQSAQGETSNGLPTTCSPPQPASTNR